MTRTTSGNDYVYDVNGNLTQDLNKGINSITYNHLNLPAEVQKNATEKVVYTYDANGVKLFKTVTTGGILIRTYYTAIGNYTENVTVSPGIVDLDFIFTAEGRIVDDAGSWRYEYYYKDHLGNTRLGFSDYDGDQEVDATEITQQSNYYPFGLEHKGTNYFAPGTATQTTHKYLFNGQEYQDELGLHITAMDWRGLDNQTGRFFGIDPLAEEAYEWSLYRFGYNNPISFGDPTGLLEDWVQDLNGHVYWDENATSQATTKKGETYLSADKFDKKVLDAVGSDIMNSENGYETYTSYLSNERLGDTYFIDAANKNYSTNASGFMAELIDAFPSIGDGVLISQMTHDWVNQAGWTESRNAIEHQIGMSLLSSKYSTTAARNIGIGNEMRGLIINDRQSGNMLNAIMGRSTANGGPTAFEWSDLYNNGIGIGKWKASNGYGKPDTNNDGKVSADEMSKLRLKHGGIDE